MSTNMQENVIDSFLKTPRLYRAKVSPDLKWVVWVWANVGPTADVYIASIDKTESPRKLTDFNQDTSIISWTEDSRFIVVNHDYDGDERFRLYKIDVNSGEVFPLTEEHPSCFIRGGQITVDGKYLIYGANYDFETKQEIDQTIAYKHNLETGERTKLAQPKIKVIDPKQDWVKDVSGWTGTEIVRDIAPEGEPHKVGRSL